MNALITTTLLVAMAAVITGCKIAVIVPSGGDVESTNPAYNCEEGKLCEFEISTTPFNESFTAIPKAGYEFEKWAVGADFLCDKATGPLCEVNIADNDYGRYSVTLFQSRYVMPIFKDVGIDTDKDGVRDALDDDIDGDGLPNAEDACPLDYTNSCAAPSYDCTNLPSTIVCGYPIDASVMENTLVPLTTVFIPQGKIIASSFSTTYLAIDSGVFKFEIPPGSKTPVTNVWVSEAPGGKPLSDACSLSRGSIVYVLSYSQTEWNNCVLEPSQRYYLNLEHVSPAAPRSLVYREVHATAYADEY